MSSHIELSTAQARRVAVAAQGLGRARPVVGDPAAPRGGKRAERAIEQAIETMAVLQIDSVNVLARSHYLPVFARVGPYPRATLDAFSDTEPRRLIEYWAHMASFSAPQVHGLLGFRMRQAHRHAWAGMREAVAGQEALLDRICEYVAEHGPLTSAQIELGLAEQPRTKGTNWGWNWSLTKTVVEYLFRSGDLASAGRSTQFERRYDLPERVLAGGAGAVRQLAEIDEAQACRELIAIAARAHGVATEGCLRDYFRLTGGQSKRAIAELVEEGRLVPARVQGWKSPGYLSPDAAVPARCTGSALLSPFDPLIWFRPRTESLFGFHYRIEIYTPAARRRFGYYVLPYLLGDRLVARVDLKSDRASGVLQVRSAWLAEPSARGPVDPAKIVPVLARDLDVMARWLGLERAAVTPDAPGELVPALTPALVDAAR